MLVGFHLLLGDFEPYGIIFIMRVVITVVMVMLLRDFGVLRDNIYDCMFTALDSPSFLTGI
jgi:hypothetical protein